MKNLGDIVAGRDPGSDFRRCAFAPEDIDIKRIQERAQIRASTIFCRELVRDDKGLGKIGQGNAGTQEIGMMIKSSFVRHTSKGGLVKPNDRINEKSGFLRNCSAARNSASETCPD